MRSTQNDDARDGDLTLRARIRDAAIALIGRDGFDRTTIRQIAERAGVSPGLVIHHFDNKHGLRDACDDHVISELVGLKTEALTGGASASIGAWLNNSEHYQSLLDYLRRLIAEDTDASATLYDRLATEAGTMYRAGVEAGTLRAMPDPEATIILLTNYSLSSLLLAHHLGRQLPGGASATQQRLAVAQGAMLTSGLLLGDAVQEAMADAFTADDAPDPDPDPDRGSTP